MNRIVMRSKVGADGVLSLSLPIGAEDANREVTIIVEPTASVSPQPDRTSWDEFVEATAGKWQGQFERPLQGQFETRDPLFY